MEPDDLPLAEMIRRRLDMLVSYLAPPPGHLRVRFGRGETCSACDRRIHPAQTVYEAHWNDTTYKFHVGCYDLWRTGALIDRALCKPG